MSLAGKLKDYRVTEYCILVCVLFLKIWCGFVNQAFLFLAGGLISTMIDFAICAYIMLNFKRENRSLKERVSTDNFLIVWLLFSLIYAMIFFLGRDALPQNSFLGLFNLPKQIYNIVFMIIYLCPLVMVLKNSTDEEKRQISNFILAIFFAVALANLVTTIANPDLVKSEAYDSEGSLFTLGYSGSYSLMLITPILMYKLGETKHKVVMSVILVCNLTSVFYGGYFIAILGTMIALLMYAILGIKNKFFVLILTLALVGSFVALIISGVLEDLMWYFADNIPIDVISGRCEDIAQYLSGDTDVTQADTTFRIFIYQDTFSQFLNHPIFGNYFFGVYNCQWDHSTILDILSVGGLFLGGLFYAVIGFGYKFACTFINKDRGRRALVAMIVSYVFIALVNSALSYKNLGMLFVIAPIMMGGTEKK